MGFSKKKKKKKGKEQGKGVRKDNKAAKRKKGEG